jgi:hypothetical protein
MAATKPQTPNSSPPGQLHPTQNPAQPSPRQTVPPQKPSPVTGPGAPSIGVPVPGKPGA